MKIISIALVVLAVYLIVEGIYGMIKGKPLSKKEEANAKKYTPESYEKNTRVSGLIMVVVGLFFLLLRAQEMFFSDISILKIVAYVGIGLGIVALILSNLLILKKVGTAGASSAVTKSGSQASDDDTEEYIDED